MIIPNIKTVIIFIKCKSNKCCFKRSKLGVNILWTGWAYYEQTEISQRHAEILA